MRNFFLFFLFPFSSISYGLLTGQHSKPLLTWTYSQHNTDNTHKNTQNVNTAVAVTHAISAATHLPTPIPTPAAPSPTLNVIPRCAAWSAARQIFDFFIRFYTDRFSQLLHLIPTFKFLSSWCTNPITKLILYNQSLHHKNIILKNITGSSKYFISSSEMNLPALFSFSFMIGNEHFNMHEHPQHLREPRFDDINDRRIHFVPRFTWQRSINPFHPFLHASALLNLHFQAWSIKCKPTESCPIQDGIQVSELASVQHRS